MGVEGKIAVVTGGTKGIGFAIAEALLKNGGKVFICGRDKRDVTRAIEWLSKHGHIEGDVCDVRSEDQVRMLLSECERRLGGLDILVNNAGMGVFGKTVAELSGGEFRQVLETN